jgi:hypothetical protein
MKKGVFVILLLFVCRLASAQIYPDYGLTKIRLIDSGKTIELEINPVKHEPTVKSGLFYYWYSANQMHSTQGGYSGQLLNGLYTEYYQNKNLKEQGAFNRGLKDGLWKSWNKDGTLKQAVTWDSGVISNEKKTSIWQRINIFKKDRAAQTDSIPKGHH